MKTPYAKFQLIWVAECRTRAAEARCLSQIQTARVVRCDARKDGLLEEAMGRFFPQKPGAFATKWLKMIEGDLLCMDILARADRTKKPQACLKAPNLWNMSGIPIDPTSLALATWRPAHRFWELQIAAQQQFSLNFEKLSMVRPQE